MRPVFVYPGIAVLETIPVSISSARPLKPRRLSFSAELSPSWELCQLLVRVHFGVFSSGQGVDVVWGRWVCEEQVPPIRRMVLVSTRVCAAFLL